jgi:hypothetical protein
VAYKDTYGPGSRCSCHREAVPSGITRAVPGALVAVLGLTVACGPSGPANSTPLLVRLAAHCAVAAHTLDYVTGGESGFNGTSPWEWRTSNSHTITLDPNNQVSGDQQWRVQCDNAPPQAIHLSTVEEDYLGVRDQQ